MASSVLARRLPGMKSPLPLTLLQLHATAPDTVQLVQDVCDEQGWGLRATPLPFWAPAPEGHTVCVVDGNDLMRVAPGSGHARCLLICQALELPRWAGVNGPVSEYQFRPLNRNRLKEQVARLRMGAAPTLPLCRSCGDLFLDPIDRRVLWKGQILDLTWREYEMLRLLSERPGHTVPRGHIEEALYRWGQDFESNTIDVLVHHLRRKLDPSFIATVRGVGFRLTAAPTPS
jgi:hypothetical protein